MTTEVIRFMPFTIRRRGDVYRVWEEGLGRKERPITPYTSRRRAGREASKLNKVYRSWRVMTDQGHTLQDLVEGPPLLVNDLTFIEQVVLFHLDRESLYSWVSQGIIEDEEVFDPNVEVTWEQVDRELDALGPATYRDKALLMWKRGLEVLDIGSFLGTHQYRVYRMMPQYNENMRSSIGGLPEPSNNGHDYFDEHPRFTPRRAQLIERYPKPRMAAYNGSGIA